MLAEDQILTAKTDRCNRARVPAPFPVHRWSERVPDVVVLPTSTEQVAAVVRIANDLRVPVVPRDGGTGLTDGAVPLRRGIVVDVKRMNQIHELDLVNRTVTVGTGINMLKLNERLARHGLIYPDNPASYPCSLVGGRIGTSGWSLIGSRYGHTRDLVLSFDHVLPTGEVMHVGDGIGGKISKSSSGYQLKHLFMGHQGTLGIATRATLKLFPKPEAELSPFWAFDDYDDAYACVGRAGPRRGGDVRRRGAVRRVQGRLPAPRRRGLHPRSRPTSGRWCARRCTATRTRCAPAAGGCSGSPRSTAPATSATRSPRATGPPGTTATPPAARPDQGRPGRADVVALRGRRDQLLERPRRHQGLARDRRRPAPEDRRLRRLGHVRLHVGDTGVDYLTEIDVGIWEQRLDDAAWAAWVQAKTDIAAAALAHGGSISACHGSCREGEVDLVPEELGRGFGVMLDVKRALDPNNIMNPGKYLLDRAYEEAPDAR